MTNRDSSGYYSYYSDSYGEYYSDDETKSPNKSSKKANKDSNNLKSKSKNYSSKSNVNKQPIPNESNNQSPLESKSSIDASNNNIPEKEQRISVSFTQDTIDDGAPVKHDNDDLDAWASTNLAKSNPYEVKKSSNPEPDDLLPYLSSAKPNFSVENKLPEMSLISKQQTNFSLEPESSQSHSGGLPPRITTHSQDSMQYQSSRDNSTQINESQGSSRSILSNPHESETEKSNQAESSISPVYKERGNNLPLEREMSDDRWFKNIPPQLHTPTPPIIQTDIQQYDSTDKETILVQSVKATLTNNSLESQVMGTNDVKGDTSKPPLIIIENKVYPPGEIASDKEKTGTDTSQSNDENSTSSGTTVNSENIWFEFAIPEIPAVDNSLFDNELSTEFDLPKLLADMKKA